MLTKTQAKEIIQALQVLPAEKLAEAYDYILFLRERYGTRSPVDVNEAWSDEDACDLVGASFQYAERTILAGES